MRFPSLSDVRLANCANEAELVRDLSNLTLMLQDWVETNRDRAYKIGMSKLGRHYGTPAASTSTGARVSAPSPALPETIISKEDADRIFSMTKTQWEGYAQRVQYPRNRKVALSKLETGTNLMAFDTKTGYGLSVQPLYPDDTSPPDILIVGSYYPAGSFPAFTEELKNNIEEAVLRDLGPAYSVRASYTKPPAFEGVELSVTKADL